MRKSKLIEIKLIEVETKIAKSKINEPSFDCLKHDKHVF